MNHVVQAWKDNGLPPNVPFFMTEGNDLDEGSPHTVKSALWLADYVGAMMTAGAGGTYYFHYIASAGRGGHGFLSVDHQNNATYSPQYLATQVITQEWVQPVDKIHKLYKATSDVLDTKGNELITAYPVERPDGRWSVMLINKDENNGHSVRVTFDDPATGQTRFFTGPVDRAVFGPAEYQWHPDPVPAADAARPSLCQPLAGAHRRRCRGRQCSCWLTPSSRQAADTRTRTVQCRNPLWRLTVRIRFMTFEGIDRGAPRQPQ